jgi:hypothetical protein
MKVARQGFQAIHATFPLFHFLALHFIFSQQPLGIVDDASLAMK